MYGLIQKKYLHLQVTWDSSEDVALSAEAVYRDLGIQSGDNSSAPVTLFFAAEFRISYMLDVDDLDQLRLFEGVCACTYAHGHTYMYF